MKERSKRSLLSLCCGTIAFYLILVSGSQAELTIYPANSQSIEQQKKDEGECRSWAMEKTGHDPDQKPLPQVQPNSTVGSQLAKGAVGGALIGTGIGAIAGSAGKGAAIGAGAGGAVLGIKENKTQQQRDAEYKQYLARYNTEVEKYDNARKACFEGRGYTVR